jgi:hypothetical protein
MLFYEDETLTEEERRDLKSTALKNSRIFNKFFWPDFRTYPEIELLSEKLILIIKQLPKFEKRKQEKKLKREMAVLLIDLYKNYLEDPHQYLGFYRNHNYYVIKRIEGTKKAARATSKYTGTVYNPCSIGRTIINTVDCLIELGYIENHKGMRFSGYKKGRVSRIKATDKLIDLFRTSSINDDCLTNKPTTENVVMFRDEDKNNTKYEENEAIKEIKDLLFKYNDLLEETYIDLNLYGKPLENIHPKKLPIKVNLRNKYYRRVFNNIESEDGRIISAGGRYYGSWTQQIPSKLRQRIVMGDPPEETEEVDFSTMHPTILAAINGFAFDTDPYEIEGYPKGYRPLFKLILLVLINSATKDKALRAIEREVRDDSDYEDFKHLNLLTVINNFEKAHQRIANHFYTGAGIRCQNIEAAIASNIIRYFTYNNKILLTVHDSFLCQKKDSYLLQKIMISAFKNILKLKDIMVVEPKLKIVQKDSNNIYLPNAPDLNLRYKRWKEFNKQIQFKRVLIMKKKE